MTPLVYHLKSNCQHSDIHTLPVASATATIITVDGGYSITANFGEIPPINWPLIGGIIAVVVAMGLGISSCTKRGLPKLPLPPPGCKI